MKTQSDKEQLIPQHFKRGDLIFFHNINTLPHLRTAAASLLHFGQSLTREGDSSVVHVGFIDDTNFSPKQGETVMNYIHSMPGEGIKKEPIIRNYHLSVFRLKPKAISPFDAEKIANKAVDFASQFIGINYSFTHCAQTLFSQHLRELVEPNEYYTRYLCERHLFDPKTKTIRPTKIDEGMHCSEAVITCLQLAVLAFSGERAFEEDLPEFIRLHYHTSPVGLHNFVKNNPWFEEVNPEQVHELRMSGVPDPRDYTQAIIPYIPPLPPTWGGWLWSQIPSPPDLSGAWAALSSVPGWFRPSAPQTSVTRHLVRHSVAPVEAQAQEEKAENTDAIKLV